MLLNFRRGLPALCALLPWSDALPFAHHDASRHRMSVPVEYSQEKPTKEQTEALNKAMEAARAAERKAVIAPAKPKAPTTTTNYSTMSADRSAGASAPVITVSKRAVLNVVNGTMRPWVDGIKALNEGAARSFDFAASLTFFDPAGKAEKQRRAAELRSWNNDWDSLVQNVINTVNGFVVGTNQTYDFPIGPNNNVYRISGKIAP